MKNIISHHKLSDLLGNMTEVQALNTLSRSVHRLTETGCVSPVSLLKVKYGSSGYGSTELLSIDGAHVSG